MSTTKTKKKIKRSLKKARQETGDELTEKNKLFVFIYITDKECYGNATKAYQKAYKCAYDTAKSNGPALLAKACIVKYKNSLLDAWFSDIEVDRELVAVLRQNKEPNAKVAAAREINRLKGRGSDKLDLTSKGESIVGITYVTPHGNNTRANAKTA